MTKITDYNIVIAKSPEALTQAVQECIRKGWQPQGGPIFINSNQGALLMQALVKIQVDSRVTLATDIAQ